MVKKQDKKKCNVCFGYGMWAWGSYVPVGPMDSKDGISSLPCPACDSNPNPIKRKDGTIIKTREELKEYYDKEK